MKNKLINFLTWALCKLDQTKLESLKIESKEIKLKLSKLAPLDDKWHQISTSIVYGVKRNRNGSVLIEDLSVWTRQLLKSEEDSLIAYFNLSETNDRTP